MSYATKGYHHKLGKYSQGDCSTGNCVRGGDNVDMTSPHEKKLKLKEINMVMCNGHVSTQQDTT